MKMKTIYITILILFGSLLMSGCSEQQSELIFSSQNNQVQMNTDDISISEVKIYGNCGYFDHYWFQLSNGVLIDGYIESGTLIQLDRPIERIYEVSMPNFRRCANVDKHIKFDYK